MATSGTLTPGSVSLDGGWRNDPGAGGNFPGGPCRYYLGGVYGFSNVEEWQSIPLPPMEPDYAVTSLRFYGSGAIGPQASVNLQGYVNGVAMGPAHGQGNDVGFTTMSYSLSVTLPMPLTSAAALRVRATAGNAFRWDYFYIDWAATRQKRLQMVV